MKTGAIIVAGGAGKRMNAGIPKQLLKISGRTIIEWTLDPFIQCPDITELVVVSEPGIMSLIHDLLKPFRATASIPITIVPGGRERQDSVRNGFAAITGHCDMIVIHDAVRPFVTPREISACIRAAEEIGAASLMIPARETVKMVRNGLVESTLDRSTVWITQTPQAFRRPIIEKAHDQAVADGFNGLDDCVLVERLELPVKAVEGSEYNIKITTPADLAIAEVLLEFLRKGEYNAGNWPRI